MTNKNISYKSEQGKRLKELRLYLRLTQDEFGEKIGLKWSQVKDRESGIVKISPSERKLLIMCMVLAMNGY
jgi:transcriptional regulator with XRE-family HTH domain